MEVISKGMNNYSDCKFWHGTHNTKRTNSFTIQSHIFSITLRSKAFSPISNKNPNRCCIRIKAPTSKALYNKLKHIKFMHNQNDIRSEDCSYLKLHVIRKVVLPVTSSTPTWYALSKKGSNPFDRINCLICSHWSEVGSTPVGLWAHAWSRTIAPDGAFPRSSNSPVYRDGCQTNIYKYKSYNHHLGKCTRNRLPISWILKSESHDS